MKMFRKILKFFDRLEDRTRSRLSRRPVLYAIIGAIGLVLLWRGVWKTADSFSLFNKVPFDKATFFDGIISIGISLVVLLISGLFVSFFVGDRIILSGLKQEKKLEEKTKEELDIEMEEIKEINIKIGNMENSLREIKDSISDSANNHDQKN